jgi:hypothetical protein
MAITEDKLQVVFLESERSKDVGKLNFEIHTEERKGIWVVTYICRKPGHYRLHVKVDHSDIAESPYRLSTAEEAPPQVELDFKQCSALGSGITSGKVGVIQKFAVTLVNTIGVKVTADSGKVTVRLKLNGKDVTELFKTVVQIIKEYWVVTYIPTSGGPLSVYVYVNDKELPSSPYTTPIMESYKGVDPSKCIARGPGVESAVANVSQRFVIQPMNNQGQPITPEEKKTRSKIHI